MCTVCGCGTANDRGRKPSTQATRTAMRMRTA